MNLLVGIDGSAHAEVTLEFVRGMSWPANTAITVCSAMPPQGIAYATESEGMIALDPHGKRRLPCGDACALQRARRQEPEGKHGAAGS